MMNLLGLARARPLLCTKKQVLTSQRSGTMCKTCVLYAFQFYSSLQYLYSSILKINTFVP